MSYDHTQAALVLELPTAPKCLLLVMAARACPRCGLTWLGTRRLQRETGLGETSLRKALHALHEKGLLNIHAYPKGGRGRATEYVVLPSVMELSTPPCGECRARMTNPARGAEIEKDAEENPARGEGFRENPAREGVKTPCTGTDQQSVRPTVTTRARDGTRVHGSGPRPTASEATPSLTLDLPPPRNAQEALAALDSMRRGLESGLTMKAQGRANSGSQEGSKAPATDPGVKLGPETEL